MRRGLVGMIGGAGALVGGLAFPLLAGLPVGAAPPPALVETPSGPAVVATGTTSPSNAGYELPTAVTSLKGTMTVPTLTCPATGGVQDDGSVQIDALSGGAGDFLDFGCENGAAAYSGSVDIFGTGGTSKNIPFAMAAGDDLVTTITATATTAKVVLTDGTKSVKISGTISGTITNGWVELQGSAPIVNFGTLKWTSVKVNGNSLESVAPYRYTLVNSKNKVLVSTSAVTGGTAFTNKFHASS